MTYKLITEQELQQAIAALNGAVEPLTSLDHARIDQALSTFRAVQERDGPKLAGTVVTENTGCWAESTIENCQLPIGIHSIYTLPEPPHD